MKTVEIKMRVNADELWADVFGSIGSYAPEWLHDIRYVTGSETKHGLCYITADVTDGWSMSTDTKVHRVYVEDIAEAYGKLTSTGYSHCGGCGLDDPDACTTDALLQMVVYGKLVYG